MKISKSKSKHKCHNVINKPTIWKQTLTLNSSKQWYPDHAEQCITKMTISQFPQFYICDSREGNLALPEKNQCWMNLPSWTIITVIYTLRTPSLVCRPYCNICFTEFNGYVLMLLLQTRPLSPKLIYRIRLFTRFVFTWATRLVPHVEQDLLKLP